MIPISIVFVCTNEIIIKIKRLVLVEFSRNSGVSRYQEHYHVRNSVLDRWRRFEYRIATAPQHHDALSMHCSRSPNIPRLRSQYGHIDLG